MKALLVLLAALAAVASAQTICNGTLTGDVGAVVVDGQACVLSGASAREVFILNGGSLVTLLNTSIAGVLTATDAGNINIDGTTIAGTIRVTSMNTTRKFRIGQHASAGFVTLRTVSNVVVRGTLSSLATRDCGNVLLQSARIAGGLTVSGGIRPVVLCGVDLSGGITLDAHTGDLYAVSTSRCGYSSIAGHLSVAFGLGNVQIVGNKVTGMNVAVTGYAGNVTLANARLGDVKFDGVTGNVLLNYVWMNGGGHVRSAGRVGIENSVVGGDFVASDNAEVILYRNDFANGVVSVSRNRGSVSLLSNTNLTSIVGGNGGVKYMNNRADSAEFTRNTGGTVVSANYLGGLKCVGNEPAVSVAGTPNNITGLATGECEGF